MFVVASDSHSNMYGALGAIGTPIVRTDAADAHPSDDHIDQCEVVEEWADKHKTFIVLNGGDNDGVKAARDIVFASGFPCISFSEPGLRSLESCVVVVLPENVFNATKPGPEYKDFSFPTDVYIHVDEAGGITTYYPNHPHYALIQLLRGSRLAI